MPTRTPDRDDPDDTAPEPPPPVRRATKPATKPAETPAAKPEGADPEPDQTESDAPAAMPEGAPLAARLAWVLGRMRHIPKAGFNQAQRYAYVRESDVANAASKLLAEASIWIDQTVVSHKRKPLYQTQSGMTMWMSTVVMEFRFVDGLTGEVTPVRTFIGTGADTGDKGVYKAMTGAEKYFLMKSFLVSTGDDPEADEKTDKTAAAASAASTGVRVRRGSQTGVRRGGRSDKATTAQVGEIARLARSLGLDAETVVPVIEQLASLTMPEGTSIRDWLSSLTSEQAGTIIEGLVDKTVNGPDSSTEISTEAEDVDEEAAEEEAAAIAIV